MWGGGRNKSTFIQGGWRRKGDSVQGICRKQNTPRLVLGEWIPDVLKVFPLSFWIYWERKAGREQSRKDELADFESLGFPTLRQEICALICICANGPHFCFFKTKYNQLGRFWKAQKILQEKKGLFYNFLKSCFVLPSDSRKELAPDFLKLFLILHFINKTRNETDITVKTYRGVNYYTARKHFIQPRQIT